MDIKNDPFIGFAPCYTEVAKLILAAAAKALSEMERSAQKKGTPSLNNFKTVFEKPQAPPVKPPQYHYVFCSHNKPYWDVCKTCGRDKSLAARNRQMFFKHLNGLPLITK